MSASDVHEIPIDGLARSARRASVAFIVVAAIALSIGAVLSVLVLGQALPDLSSPLALWCWLFTGLAFVYLVLSARLSLSFTRPHLWLVLATVPVFVALVVAFIATMLPDDKRAALRALSTEHIVIVGMIGAAIIQLLAWLLIYPPAAAVGLLRSKAGAGDLSFVDTMRDAVSAGSQRHAAASHRQSMLLEVAALVLALAAFLVVNWFAWHRSDIFLFMVATVLALPAMVAAYPLWRRFRASAHRKSRPRSSKTIGRRYSFSKRSKTMPHSPKRGCPRCPGSERSPAPARPRKPRDGWHHALLPCAADASRK